MKLDAYLVTMKPRPAGTVPVQVLNLSSSGMLLSTGVPLEAGDVVAVSVKWPVQLEDGCALWLRTLGKVLRRGEGSTVSVSIVSYEFLTRSHRECVGVTSPNACAPNGT